MDPVYRILGEYSYQFIVISSGLPYMMACALLFTLGQNHKNHFLLRLCSGTLLVILADLGLAVLRTNVATLATRLLVNLLTYCFLLPLLFFCFQEPPVNILLDWCAALAAQDIATRLHTVLLILAGKDPLFTMSFFQDFVPARDWTISYCIQGAAVLLLFRLFHRAKCLEADQEMIRTITRLSVFFAVWSILFQSISRQYMSESLTLYLLLSLSGIVTSLSVLLLRNGLLTQNQYRQEIAMTEKLLREERKIYDSAKESVEIVNMRCHDLKHQLEDLSSKLTKEEIARLQGALEQYDNTIHTGNEVLDVVLYEKQLVFTKEGIRFTYLVDGTLLQFMRTSHLFSLFNNALGNALEAVRKLEDPEKKVIDLTVRQDHQTVDITVTNYFNGVVNEDLSTTKTQPAGHGLGLKSMRYVTEQCGGSLTTSISGEIFELNCRIPIPAERAAA